MVLLTEKYQKIVLQRLKTDAEHCGQIYIRRPFNRHINRVVKSTPGRCGYCDWLRKNYSAVDVDGEHTGMHFVLRCPDRDISEPVDKYNLISKNNYSVHNYFNDSVIIGIGEESTEEIIRTLNEFLKEIYE